MKPPKLDTVTAFRLQSMGLKIGQAYQPQERFKSDPPRTLKRVARSDDPWRVTLVRMDRSALEVGAFIATGEGDTFEEALEAIIPVGVTAEMLRLERAMDRLIGTIRAR